MKRIAVFFPTTQPRLLAILMLLLFVTAPAGFLLSTSAPVLPAASAAQQPAADCRAVVARLQQAVNAEASASADARSTQCKVLSLPVESRAGRPQAINDSTQRKLLAAVKETAAAKDAARGCDTSRVERPKTTRLNVEARNVMMACYYAKHAEYSYVRRLLLLDPFSDTSGCAKLANDLNCADLTNIEEPVTKDETVYVPSSLRPECREAYLQFKAAELEYKNAHDYERKLSRESGAAGPRGQVMWTRAREDVKRASQKKVAAERKLEDCTTGAGENKKAVGRREVSVAGSWWAAGINYQYSFTQNGKIFSWKVTNQPSLGETADGEFTGENSIKVTWKNKDGEGSATGTITSDANGNAVRINWSNGIVFTRK